MIAMGDGVFADEPDPPAGLDEVAGEVLRFDLDAFPLCVQVPAGWWRIFPLAGAGERAREYVAQLVTGPDGPVWGGRPVFTARQPTLWRLEESLGWALPLAGHATLQAAPAWTTTSRQQVRRPGAPRTRGGMPPRSGPLALPDSGRRLEYRPWRASLVLRAHHPPATYGRLRHGEGPTPRWDWHETSVEVVAAEPVAVTAGGGGHRLAYRLSHRGQVVFAGEGVPLARGHQPRSTEAIRAVVTAVTTGRGADPLLEGQRSYLEVCGPALAAAARPVGHPYPWGTRIAVSTGGGARWTTGTVLGTAGGRGGRLEYLWRPDVADLPGHPWRQHRGLVLRAGVREVTVSLDRPDVHTVTPHGEDAVLATGALVATIDDPRFAVGTVLRAYAGDGGPTPRYEIQPHDAPTGPVVLGATDVTGRAGTAWPTVADLLLARAAAGLDLRPFELIMTVRDYALAADSPHGPHLAITAGSGAVDAALDPDRHADSVDVAARPGRPPTAALGVIPISGFDGVCRLHHPLFGPIAVDGQLLARALAADPGQLAAVLARYPWLPAGPHPPLVAAYLAAKHATPDELAALAQQAGPTPARRAAGPSDRPAAPGTARPGGTTTPTDTPSHPPIGPDDSPALDEPGWEGP